MAKFRQGNLVLTSDQKIIQGSDVLVDANGVANFATLGVSGLSTLDTLDVSGDSTLSTLGVSGLSTLSTLTFASGATISEFSTDGSLAGDSDTAIPTEKAIKTYVDSQIGGTIPTGIDERVVRYNGTNAIQDSLVSIDDSGNVSGVNNLSVNGNVYIDGTAFVVNTEVVTTSGNLITLNYGEPGAGVTSGISGIQVDRGTLTDYQFVFVEADDNFQVGEIGSLQAVATREASPTDQYFPYWNDASKRFDTTNSTIELIPTGIQATVSAFDIKTSGGEDAITINNDGSIEFYHDNVKVGETTTNGISGAVWG